MRHVDYIIVGGGYTGYFFAHQLIKNEKSFVIYDTGLSSASRISAGIVNPVVLKKFTTFWLAMEQIQFLRQSLNEIKSYLKEDFWIDEPVMRIFHDEKERNFWIKKSSEPVLKDFLSDQIHFLNQVHNPFGCGTVKHSGRLHVQRFFSCFTDFLVRNQFLREEEFEYSMLDSAHSTYRDLKFSNIIFCEGTGIESNPWFNVLPVKPNKGHQLKVVIKELHLHETVKKKHFLFPLKSNSYYYGGTYDRHAENSDIDELAVDQLRTGLAEISSKKSQIEEINVGFRPTVADRRPIIGAHLDLRNFYVFNGLGARGILNGNYFAKELYEHIEHWKPLHPEVDVKRFQ